MTEHQYPIHLRKIGEHQIAEFLETLMIELDTHEKMFLELCQVKREKEALEEIVRGRCDSIEDLPVSKDSARVALKIVERYLNAHPIGSITIIAEYNVDNGYRLCFRNNPEVRDDV